MENQLNTGKLETLTMGDVLLVKARNVSGDKIQLEFAEVLENSTRSKSALGMFNKSDDRFTSGARRAWLTSEAEDASELLGIDVDFTEEGNWEEEESTGYEIMPLYILNPTVEGVSLKVQVTETTTPTEWQEENVKRAAKKAGRDGDYITHEGNYIFSNTEVVIDEAIHTFLQPDSTGISSPKAIAAIEQKEFVDENTGEIVNAEINS
tara:strand:+ start:54 stop:677 length:624 start_codon:yes stop_codon:yes gene_type:complete